MDVGKKNTWYNNYGNQVEVSQKKKLPHDPSIQILGTYPRTPYLPSHIASLFIVGRKWNRPGYLLSDEWIMNM